MHRIQLRTGNGLSLEGAPYALFAPIASQADVQAYVVGVVGSGNTIDLIDIPPGRYRLVIRPIGINPIEVMVSIGSDSELMVLQLHGSNLGRDDGTSGPSASILSADISVDASVVTGLPSTGVRNQPDSTFQLTLMIALTGMALMAIGLGVHRTRNERG